MTTLSKTHHPRLGALAALASAALLLGSTFTAAPASAAPDDDLGQLTVTVVDALGRPAPASVMAMTTDGSTSLSFPTMGGPPPYAFSHTYTDEVPEGRYGFMVMAFWGGLVCSGVSPCSPPTGPEPVEPTVTGAVDVTDNGAPASHTVTVPVPATISGSSAVGGLLTMAISPQQQQFLGSIFGVPGVALGSYEVQWRRNGVAIPGATAMTYRPTNADAAQNVDAVLSYPALVRTYMSTYGFPVSDYAVPGARVGKAATKTTVDLFRKKIKAGRSTGLRADVTSGGQAVPDGKVKVAIGKWKASKPVRNGTARVAIPTTLKPGKYQVVVTYVGSKTYLGSKAKKQTLVITKK